MARIIHRPKPEVIVAPDYNKVLQNIKSVQQSGMQARAEQGQARSRFEQALQKAAGKGDQNTQTRSLARNPGSERVSVGTNRVLEKNSTLFTRHEGLRPDGNHQQTPLSAKSGRQTQRSSESQPVKQVVEISENHETNVRQAQETNPLHSALSSLKPEFMLKSGISDEDESVTDANLESLACPSPLGLQESLPCGIEVAPMARARDFSQFESMLNHLSLMTARYGPRDWTFEIQNENSSLVSVSLAPAGNGGWNVAVTARTEDQSEARRYLDELEAMLQDTLITSLNIVDQDQTQERTGS